MQDQRKPQISFNIHNKIDL